VLSNTEHPTPMKAKIRKQLVIRYLNMISISSYIQQGNETVRKPVNETDHQHIRQCITTQEKKADSQ